MALKYYADENRRHPIAEAIKLTFDQAKEVTQWLCGMMGLEIHEVTLLDSKTKRFSRVKKTKSWYSPGTSEIVYHPSMLNMLTIAHEVAHYAHDMDRRKRFLAAREAADKAGKVFRFRKEKWHGPEHRAFVEGAIIALKNHPKFGAFFAENETGETLRLTTQINFVFKYGAPETPKNDLALDANGDLALTTTTIA